MEGIIENEKLFTAHDYFRDNYEDMSKQERLFSRILSEEIEDSEDWEDFKASMPEHREIFRKEGLETEFNHFLEKLYSNIPKFDQQTVETIKGLENWSWRGINDALQTPEGLESEEVTYWNRMAEMDSDDYSANLMVQYAKEARMGDPEVFETTVHKVFSGFDAYLETLDELEMLPVEDHQVYMDKLRNQVEETRLDTDVRAQLEDLIDDASDPVQLAAYTEERLDFLGDSRPELGNRLKKEVKEIYIRALPTEAI